MNSFKLQTRYAQSLFDLAQENNAIDRVYEDMLLIKKVCEESPQLKAILKNPVIKPSKKKSIIHDIFSSKVEQISILFMELLVTKRRDVILFEIADRYTELYKEFNHIKTVRFTTAQVLDEVIVDDIRREIEEKLSSKIDLQLFVNPKLLGGFSLTVEGKQYDASFSKQITKLKKEFNKNIYERIF
ncbi:MAG: ATP synthase F1 subunit delta [Bacteroidales bacterium]|jgi:F-type H+-transporting ATPase subunit delta|nr:ATP synthase F1 subunit delta [Bacteroidales bacterium]